MVKCPQCLVELLTTTKEYEIQVGGISVGILPVEVGQCATCNKKYVFLTVKLGENSLNISAVEVFHGQAQ